MPDNQNVHDAEREGGQLPGEQSQRGLGTREQELLVASSYVDIARVQVQRTLDVWEDFIRFLKWVLGFSLLVTLPSFLAVLFLTGWKDKTGFEVSDKVLMFLGGLTIGEVAGLITTCITGFKGPRSG